MVIKRGRGDLQTGVVGRRSGLERLAVGAVRDAARGLLSALKPDTFPTELTLQGILSSKTVVVMRGRSHTMKGKSVVQL